MNNNLFGNKLKALRLKTGLTQAQLADKLNISASTVGMYEQGRREPDNDMLSKLCHILSTSGDYLLGIDSSPSKNLEVDKVISDFINFLENQDKLIFNGQPIDQKEKNRIVSAIRVATAISISEFNQDF